ncbi:hypothetical protein BS50DRAFT_587570 [Corynespora cassiicola Philippines]|uniref:Uncharacterized protein n=1 Tax=Corynespora cassiicola Philippines TaxID=1448308 RepID=A0A2T2NSH4_CORCC|nr:hypothetical protein BS50DRAFT_587570 [Corynespora cassiicola Philippines]
MNDEDYATEMTVLLEKGLFDDEIKRKLETMQEEMRGYLDGGFTYDLALENVRESNALDVDWEATGHDSDNEEEEENIEMMEWEKESDDNEGSEMTDANLSLGEKEEVVWEGRMSKPVSMGGLLLQSPAAPPKPKLASLAPRGLFERTPLSDILKEDVGVSSEGQSMSLAKQKQIVEDERLARELQSELDGNPRRHAPSSFELTGLIKDDEMTQDLFEKAHTFRYSSWSFQSFTDRISTNTLLSDREIRVFLNEIQVFQVSVGLQSGYPTPDLVGAILTASMKCVLHSRKEQGHEVHLTMAVNGQCTINVIDPSTKTFVDQNLKMRKIRLWGGLDCTGPNRCILEGCDPSCPPRDKKAIKEERKSKLWEARWHSNIVDLNELEKRLADISAKDTGGRLLKCLAKLSRQKELVAEHQRLVKELSSLLEIKPSVVKGDVQGKLPTMDEVRKRSNGMTAQFEDMMAKRKRKPIKKLDERAKQQPDPIESHTIPPVLDAPSFKTPSSETDIQGEPAQEEPVQEDHTQEEVRKELAIMEEIREKLNLQQGEEINSQHIKGMINQIRKDIAQEEEELAKIEQEQRVQRLQENKRSDYGAGFKAAGWGLKIPEDLAVSYIKHLHQLNDKSATAGVGSINTHRAIKPGPRQLTDSDQKEKGLMDVLSGLKNQALAPVQDKGKGHTSLGLKTETWSNQPPLVLEDQSKPMSGGRYPRYFDSRVSWQVPTPVHKNYTVEDTINPTDTKSERIAKKMKYVEHMKSFRRWARWERGQYLEAIRRGINTPEGTETGISSSTSPQAVRDVGNTKPAQWPISETDSGNQIPSKEPEFIPQLTDNPTSIKDASPVEPDCCLLPPLSSHTETVATSTVSDLMMRADTEMMPPPPIPTPPAPDLMMNGDGEKMPPPPIPTSTTQDVTMLDGLEMMPPPPIPTSPDVTIKADAKMMPPPTPTPALPDLSNRAGTEAIPPPISVALDLTMMAKTDTKMPHVPNGTHRHSDAHHPNGNHEPELEA